MPDTKKIKNTKIAFIMLSIMAVAAVLSFTARAFAQDKPGKQRDQQYVKGHYEALLAGCSVQKPDGLQGIAYEHVDAAEQAIEPDLSVSEMAKLSEAENEHDRCRSHVSVGGQSQRRKYRQAEFPGNKTAAPEQGDE